MVKRPTRNFSPRIMLGQPSWKIASPRVEAFVTEAGGHLGPVTFDRRGKKIQPFSIAPWAEEPVERGTPQLIKSLRGDFFCLPFGGNTTPWRGEQHPPHGETANGRWSRVATSSGNGMTGLHLRLRGRVRGGQVDKHILIGNDHDAVYQRHIVSGMSGPTSLGHHAMLKFPDEPGSGVISSSGFQFGQVLPEPAERPENRGYSMLKPGATFEALDHVPTTTGDIADLSRYPARRGFEEIVMLVGDPRTGAAFAWMAVTFPRQRYAWFALKDPRILHHTILWMSNGGRHYAPWNGRHVNVLGVEDVTSYFHFGLAESVNKNPLNRRGIATHVTLDPQRPLSVNYIMGVAPLPAGFDRISAIEAETGSLILRSTGGHKRVRVPLDANFLGL